MRKQSPRPASPRARPLLGDLADLTAFAQLVESRSFSAAGRAMGATTSAVSKRIAHLEAAAGVRLVERTTRRVALTEAGAALYERTVRVLDALADAEQAVAHLGGAARGTLRVSAPVAFGGRYVAPALPALLAQHPELRLELALADRFVNLVEEGFDAAVRIGRLADSSLTARRLARLPTVVVAAPAYLARRGTPRSPAELHAHECLRYTMLPAAREWRFRDPVDGREFGVPVTARAASNDGAALCAMAIAGAGLAHLPRFYAADALRAGTLRAVLDAYRPPEPYVHVVYPAGRAPLPKVRAFAEHLAAVLPSRLAD